MCEFYGRYDLDDIVFHCNECKNEQYLEAFWIGCVERHSQYLFDEGVFLFFDYLQKFNPGLSTLGFLHTLEQFSAEKNRVRIRYCMWYNSQSHRIL